ncbi:transposase [Nonomuraea sp. NPDC052129]|uniref:transposase n=1 Tax=Nonomuraea sp. NPDC052129 TaxID=3154651 RepID=UPI003433EB29
MRATRLQVVSANFPSLQVESCWDPDRINTQRLGLLLAEPVTIPHAGGVLVIDDSGDRKDGTATAHVGRQWLGRFGKTDNGVVTVTTLWAYERLYYPLHAQPVHGEPGVQVPRRLQRSIR